MCVYFSLLYYILPLIPSLSLSLPPVPSSPSPSLLSPSPITLWMQKELDLYVEKNGTVLDLLAEAYKDVCKF